MSASPLRRDLLVAVIRTDRDLARFLDERIYRIPDRALGRALAADALDEIRWIAPYQTREITGGLACAVESIARVESIESARRIELFPEEPEHRSAQTLYHLLHLSEPQPLPSPLVWDAPRRFVFLRTTRERFERAGKLDDLPIGPERAERLIASIVDRADRIGEPVPVFDRRRFMLVDDDVVEVEFGIDVGGRRVDVICEEAASFERTEDSRGGARDDHSIIRFSSDRIDRDLDRCVRDIFRLLRYRTDGPDR